MTHSPLLTRLALLSVLAATVAVAGCLQEKPVAPMPQAQLAHPAERAVASPVVRPKFNTKEEDIAGKNREHSGTAMGALESES
ncbi:MAG: hypothetical protein HY308_08965 [Gammaproteobacteria bacterium]|nr:hypothetical protein [Gammaproteobacteria bacterium]